MPSLQILNTGANDKIDNINNDDMVYLQLKIYTHNICIYSTYI